MFFQICHSDRNIQGYAVDRQKLIKTKKASKLNIKLYSNQKLTMFLFFFCPIIILKMLTYSTHLWPTGNNTKLRHKLHLKRQNGGISGFVVSRFYLFASGAKLDLKTLCCQSTLDLWEIILSVSDQIHPGFLKVTTSLIIIYNNTLYQPFYREQYPGLGEGCKRLLMRVDLGSVLVVLAIVHT